MRTLMLATASAIVLGMAGAGIGHAAEPDSSPTNRPGSAMETPSAMTASEILITAAQQQLKYSGLYDGSVDGKMGSETQRALRHFQQQHGLRPTVTLDERTYTALQGDAGGDTDKSAPAGHPMGSLQPQWAPTIPAARDAEPDPTVAQAFAKHAPERCVWGSDWPHPGVRDPEAKPDDAVLFDLLLPGRRTRRYATVSWSRTRRCFTTFRRMPNQFSNWVVMDPISLASEQPTLLWLCQQQIGRK